MAAAAACVSAAGILNALPNQDRVYKAWSKETGQVAFLGLRDAQDPVYAAYRWLATQPDVGAVWHADRHYHATPGYYHLATAPIAKMASRWSEGHPPIMVTTGI